MPEERPAHGLQGLRKRVAGLIARPIVALLARTPITPNALTVLSFVVALGAAVLIATGRFVVGGLVVLFASVFDMLDGALARSTGRVTRFGAALDSTLDRLAEGVIFAGLGVAYARHESVIGVGLVALALIGSFLVSYVRARAEGLGIECEVGISTRSERIAILVLGLLLSRIDYALTAAIVLVLLLSFITVGQRLFLVWQKTRA